MKDKQNIIKNLQRKRIIPVKDNPETDLLLERTEEEEKEFQENYEEFKKLVKKEGGIIRYVQRRISEEYESESLLKNKWEFNEKLFEKREKWNSLSIRDQMDYIEKLNFESLVENGLIKEDARQKAQELRRKNEKFLEELDFSKLNMKQILQERREKYERWKEEMRKREEEHQKMKDSLKGTSFGDGLEDVIE